MKWTSLMMITCLAAACLQAAAQDWPEVPKADLSKLEVSAFSDEELVVPFYLAHFARLANSIESSGEYRGFITLPVWRPEKFNKPFNARVLENYVTLAYFYCTDRPWNPYYGHEAVKVRLEAILDFWCRSQNEEGWFSEYKPNGWNLPATGFATMFMGETLRLLHDGPPIDPGIHKRTIAADRKAIDALLTSKALFDAGRSCSNQYSCLWAAILAYLDVYPDAALEALMRQRLGESLEAHQSPAGYWYEAGGCDFPYTLRTHSGNLLMAWHYAHDTDSAPFFIKGQTRWAEWVAYNSVPEPDGKTFTLNRAIETRTPGDYVTRHDPLGEKAPLLRAFTPTDEEMAAETAAKRRQLEADWPKVPELEVGGHHAYSPHPILNLAHRRWYPTEAQRREAIATVPCLARETFNHQRTDSRYPQTYTFIRRPAYYAIFNAGKKITGSQRFGLGLLWTPAAGTLMQSKSASNTAAWGTQKQDAKSVYETQLRGAQFTVDGESLTPEPGAQDLPAGPVSVTYPLGSEGSKTIAFGEDTITVEVNHAGAFDERLPLLVPEGGKILIDGATIKLTASDGGVVLTITADRAASPGQKETDLIIAGKKVVTIVYPAQDKLTYALRPGK